tara:strand:- start:142733 stop:142921 length:189 start_codon:yes stop_codon:yes gene_type:complete
MSDWNLNEAEGETPKICAPNGKVVGELIQVKNEPSFAKLAAGFWTVEALDAVKQLMLGNENE